MRDPDLVKRAERAATALERAWEHWRIMHGFGGDPLPPVSSYVGYSLEEPWGQPRVVFGVAAEEAERLAALLDGHDCVGPIYAEVTGRTDWRRASAGEPTAGLSQERLTVPAQAPQPGAESTAHVARSRESAGAIAGEVSESSADSVGSDRIGRNGDGGALAGRSQLPGKFPAVPLVPLADRSSTADSGQVGDADRPADAGPVGQASGRGNAARQNRQESQKTAMPSGQTELPEPGQPDVAVVPGTQQAAGPEPESDTSHSDLAEPAPTQGPGYRGPRYQGSPPRYQGPDTEILPAAPALEVSPDVNQARPGKGRPPHGTRFGKSRRSGQGSADSAGWPEAGSREQAATDTAV